MVFWITPNTVLTLSGARGYADGVFYSAHKADRERWVDEISRCMETLRGPAGIVDYVVGSDVNPAGQTYVSYDFLVRDGLAYSLSQTDLIANGQVQHLLDNASKLPGVIPAITAALQGNKTFASSTVDLSDIASGLLYGYPDAAVVSAEQIYNQPERPFGEKLIDADIRGADFYDCPQPVYSYARSMSDDTAIRIHEQLWSTILQNFYDSDFHRTLAADRTFRAKLEATGTLCRYPEYLESFTKNA